MRQIITRALVIRRGPLSASHPKMHCATLTLPEYLEGGSPDIT